MPSPQNTKTDIINMALSHLRQTNFIASPADTSEQALVANLWYDKARRKVLRECDWTFCRKNVLLNSLGDVQTATDNPTILADQDIIPGYIWTYAQPPHCLAIRYVYSPNYGDWPDVIVDPFRDQTKPIKRIRKAEHTLGRAPISDLDAVACNLAVAWAVYTWDETDESRFDDSFVNAFALALSIYMCMALTANEALMQTKIGEYDLAMGEAKRINHQEETEMTPQADDSPWMQARNS